MSAKVCLLFVGEQAGKAEEALTFYTSVFPDSEILSLEHYTADDAPEVVGNVKMAQFTVRGSPAMAMDSSLNHAFTFTPAVSWFVECDSAAELEDACARLSDGGAFLMPLDDYGFSQRFAWVEDRYGVSWQLNLA
ncbi:MAG: VOC family protein [Pseudomonadota bacterium]